MEPTMLEWHYLAENGARSKRKMKNPFYGWVNFCDCITFYSPQVVQWDIFSCLAIAIVPDRFFNRKVYKEFDLKTL